MESNWLMLPLFGLVTVAAQAQDTSRPLVDDSALQDAGMFRYWQANVPLTEGDSLADARLVDDALYIKTSHGLFFALAADTGLLRWGAKLTEPDYVIHDPTHIRTADGRGPVIIPTTTEVFVYDRFSGDLIRRFHPGFATGSAAVAFEDMVFMGSSDGRFYSFTMDLQRRMGPVRRWEVLAGGPVTAAPLLRGVETIVFASHGGAVYSCSGWDKTLDWSFNTQGPILGHPVMDAGGIYVASLDRALYKLNSATGRLVWKKLLPRPLTEGPVLAAHTVFQYCEREGLLALDAQTGREKWRRPGGRSFVAHHGKGDAILTSDGQIELVDNSAGTVRSAISVASLAGAAANTKDDALYLFARDGRVVCVRVDSIPYLRRQRVMAARKRLHLPPAGQTPDGTAAVVDSDSVPTKSSDPLRSRRDQRP